MPTVKIEFDQAVYDQLSDALKDVTLPPVREEGRIVTPLAYVNPVEDWVAEVMENNISNIMRHRPTGPLKAIQDQIADLEKETRRLMKPKVRKEN